MNEISTQACRGDNPLIRKLGRFVPLTEAEREALDELSRKSRHHVQGSDLIEEGDNPRAVFLILKGWAFRYKQLADGSRQIMAYLVPGDLCDIQIFLFETMDHSIGLLSDAEVVKIPSAEILDLMDRFPRIERALLWASLVDGATLREWLLNVGQRLAKERVAHLFCELYVRLAVVGLVEEDGSIPLPLTQEELADTTGMTTVHVNRTLQRLRKEGLISTPKGRLKILNFPKLAEAGGFSQEYLHIDGPPIEQRLRKHLAQLE
ncbi:MAG: Crp/Fnr family transcriptional regulator [Sphingomicrobium sp.]